MKLNWFDVLVYRLYVWWWSPILASRPDLRETMIAYLRAFDVVDNGTSVVVTVTIEPADAATE